MLKIKDRVIISIAILIYIAVVISMITMYGIGSPVTIMTIVILCILLFVAKMLW